MAHFFLIYLLDALGLLANSVSGSGTIVCDIVALPRFVYGSHPVNTADNWSFAVFLSPQIEIGNNQAVSNTYYMIQPLFIVSNSDATYTMKRIEIARISNAIQIQDVSYLTIRVSNKAIICENGTGFWSAGNIFCISW